MNDQIEAPVLRTRIAREQWQQDIAPYRKVSLKHSLWQMTNTLLPLFFLWYLMYAALGYSYWLTLALAPLAVGCHIRTFIIFHDCCHGSFFKAGWANDLLGFICGVICLTPYYHWRHSHALHHASSGDLGRRINDEMLPMALRKYTGTNGNILTLTVKEYARLSPWQQLVYRIYRHPLILFVLIPTLLFLVLHRFGSAKTGKRERLSVLFTNLAILSVSLLLILNIGLLPFLLVELPIIVLTSSLAVWLFYVQHQFEQAYWEQKPDWDFVRAALEGSSYYKLPRLLQWFTGNIGFHHIHHLSPRVPNYYLERCHRASLLFQQTQALTLRSGLRTIFANLWDEEQRKMVRFHHLKSSYKQPG